MNDEVPPPRPDQNSFAHANPRGRRRWPLVLIGFLIGVGAVLWVTGLLLYVGHDHPGGFIDDRAFSETANMACRNAYSTFPPPAEEHATLDDRANAVEESNARLGALVDELATIPVEATDRKEVAWWIARWRQFLAIGPPYAAAIRSGDPEIYTAIGELGDEPARDINEFAENNDIVGCRI